MSRTTPTFNSRKLDDSQQSMNPSDFVEPWSQFQHLNLRKGVPTKSPDEVLKIPAGRSLSAFTISSNTSFINPQVAIPEIFPCVPFDAPVNELSNENDENSLVFSAMSSKLEAIKASYQAQKQEFNQSNFATTQTDFNNNYEVDKSSESIPTNEANADSDTESESSESAESSTSSSSNDDGDILKELEAEESEEETLEHNLQENAEASAVDSNSPEESFSIKFPRPKNISVRRNEVLLNIWTDSGSFSKIDAMKVACSVMEAVYDEQALRKSLDMKNKDDFNSFCANLYETFGFDDEMEQLHKQIQPIHYRLLWRVYGLFNNAIENDEKPTTSRSRGRRPSMCLHEKFINKYNPALTEALSSADQFKVFIITYGRYVALAEVCKCPHLKNNPLNPYLKKYHEQLSSTVPGTFLSLPSHLESQIEQVPNATLIDKLLYLENCKVLGGGEATRRVVASSSPENSFNIDPGNVYSIPTSDIEKESTSSKPRSKSNKIKNAHKHICLLNCRYDVVKSIAVESHFHFTDLNGEWNILWTDGPLSDKKFEELGIVLNARTIDEDDSDPYISLQKLNHFPGMIEICRKDLLARNLKKMQKLFKNDYNFFPETWNLPNDYTELAYYDACNKNSTYICKPYVGAQGKGIFLVRDIESLDPEENFICQRYIARPYLFDDFKFDLRIYALVTCCDPLRIYIYKEGIARFATLNYEFPNDTNIDESFMHLTNYSLNKTSDSFSPLQSKKKLSFIYRHLKKQGHNVKKIVAAIDSVIVQTMISAQVPLKSFYKLTFPSNEFGSLCFELLGFDIILDENLKPYLLEVNHSPSFHLDLPVDEEIKKDLIKDTLAKIYLGSLSDQSNQGKTHADIPLRSFNMKDPTGAVLTPALQKQFHHESLHGHGFRMIYPDSNRTLLYSKFLNQANLAATVASESA